MNPITNQYERDLARGLNGGQLDGVTRIALRICQDQENIQEVYGFGKATPAEITILYQRLIAYFNDDCHLRGEGASKERFICLEPNMRDGSGEKVRLLLRSWGRETADARSALDPTFKKGFGSFFGILPTHRYMLQDGIPKYDGFIISDNLNLKNPQSLVRAVELKKFDKCAALWKAGLGVGVTRLQAEWDIFDRVAPTFDKSTFSSIINIQIDFSKMSLEEFRKCAKAIVTRFKTRQDDTDEVEIVSEFTTKGYEKFGASALLILLGEFEKQEMSLPESLEIHFNE
jgi:hypothetical protein